MKELNTPVNTVPTLKLVTRNNSWLLFLFSEVTTASIYVIKISNVNARAMQV